MAEPHPAEDVTLSTALGGFSFVELVTYPNGGTSSFFKQDRIALIVDDGICDRRQDEPVFDYSLITSKQNEYVARYSKVYRLLREDLDELARFAVSIEFQELETPRKTADRANIAEASPLERSFEEHFANVYGSDSARYLWREYGITDADGRVRYLDFIIQTKEGLIGVEENGISYHHPQIIGKQRYRTQLLKQNSCQHAGIRLFRFSTEDCRFTDRLEDDIRSYFGGSTDAFVERGIEIERPFELYEHQQGALEEMQQRRDQGIRSFLAVFPTASGKSRIVEEDLGRFALSRPGFRALVAAPNRAIVDDWKARIHSTLPAYEDRVLACTYGYITRHYSEYSPTHFDYVIIDEAHHAVAPALKRTIQYFDPMFLVGLTATDQRPDK